MGVDRLSEDVPFLYEITLDQYFAWRPPRHDASVCVDNFGGNVGKDLSYGFHSLGDWIRGRRLERHGAG